MSPNLKEEDKDMRRREGMMPGRGPGGFSYRGVPSPPDGGRGGTRLDRVEAKSDS